MLWPFNTVPQVVVILNHTVISFLLHNCNFVTVMDHNVNIWYTRYLIFNASQRGHCPHVENYWSRRCFVRHHPNDHCLQHPLSWASTLSLCCQLETFYWMSHTYVSFRSPERILLSLAQLSKSGAWMARPTLCGNAALRPATSVF
jgi:hypothetical protein